MWTAPDDASSSARTSSARSGGMISLKCNTRPIMDGNEAGQRRRWTRADRRLTGACDGAGNRGPFGTQAACGHAHFVGEPGARPPANRGTRLPNGHRTPRPCAGDRGHVASRLPDVMSGWCGEAAANRSPGVSQQ